MAVVTYLVMGKANCKLCLKHAPRKSLSPSPLRVPAAWVDPEPQEAGACGKGWDGMDVVGGDRLELPTLSV